MYIQVRCGGPDFESLYTYLLVYMFYIFASELGYSSADIMGESQRALSRTGNHSTAPLANRNARGPKINH